MKLEWNVFIEDFNNKKISPYNVFNHISFLTNCAKAAKKAKDKDEFAALVRRELHYYFWCKCEYEIILSCWPPHDSFPDRKVDISTQIELNWDRFVEYLWSNQDELIEEAKKYK